MSLLWYYRPEHTKQGRQKGDMPDELFASKHRDVNSVACIDDRCYVLTFNEYCRSVFIIIIIFFCLDMIVIRTLRAQFFYRWTAYIGKLTICRNFFLLSRIVLNTGIRKKKKKKHVWCI